MPLVNSKIPPFLLANDEMSVRTREYDWNNHDLGPIEQWPESLITSLGILLKNNFPMFLFWGEESYCFYNEAYRPSLGKADIGKHPSALGKPAKEVWSEIWHIIGPQIQQVLSGGESTWHEDQLVPIYRNGAIEEVYWTYCYSPVVEKSGDITGVMVTCMETTRRIKAEEKYKIEARRVEESERRFRSLAENLPDMVSRHDIEGGFTYANPKVEKYLGIDSNGFAGKSIKQLNWPDETVRLFEHSIKSIFTNGKPLSFNFQTPNGEHIYARLMPEVDARHQVDTVLFIGTDITELKKKELIYQDNKERLQAALDASLTGTFRWNIETNELSWDANLDRLFGLPPGETVQSLDSFVERVYVDDRKGVIDLCKKCALDGSDFLMQFRVVWPDGTIHWLDDKGKTYKSESGTPIYITGACVDVTESVEANKRIEESERRFRSTFENAAVGVAHVALDGTWLLTNDKLLSITGYSKQELASLTFQEITHPDDLAEDLFNAGELLAGRLPTYTIEKRYIRKDGDLIWVNLTVSLLRDEHQNPLCFLSIIEDISARKKAEEDRVESENQVTQLSDFMPQIVWAAHPTGDVYFWNRRWYDFTGLTFSETKDALWLKVLHPDDLEKTLRIWNHSLQTGDHYERKYRMRRCDGEYRWQLARAMPIRNINGEIARWFGTCTDIHDQKTAEEQLEILVAERTRDLQRSNEDLQQFAHVASHDLKEPLRKVRFFADKLTMLVQSGDHTNTVFYLEKIDRSVQRMFSMLNGVLEYASIDAGPIISENVDLNAVMRIIEFDLESLLKQKNADLQYHQLPSVFGVNILVQRVFFNLIYNSLKFSRVDCDPVINVSASIVCNHIEANREFDGEYCRITIEDNGIGFSEQDEEIIFGTFIRLHSKDTYEGAGLGLALCRRIIERLNGYIYARGSKKGATFVILLPAAKVFDAAPEFTG